MQAHTTSLSAFNRDVWFDSALAPFSEQRKNKASNSNSDIYTKTPSLMYQVSCKSQNNMHREENTH